MEEAGVSVFCWFSNSKDTSLDETSLQLFYDAGGRWHNLILISYECSVEAWAKNLVILLNWGTLRQASQLQLIPSCAWTRCMSIKWRRRESCRLWGNSCGGGFDDDWWDRPQQMMHIFVGHFITSSLRDGDSSDWSSESSSSSIFQLSRFPCLLGSFSCNSATISLVTWMRRASSLSSSKLSASGL